jgi:choline dehydrogenase-like flavoprotein
LSGIGRKSVLEPLGIDCKIDLPGVGENLQEHMLITTVWKLKPDSEHDTFDLMRTPGFAEEQKRLHAENKGMHRLGLTSFAYLPWRFAFANGEEKKLIEDKVAELEKNKDKFPPGLWEQYKIQIENLRDEAVPDLELAVFPGFYTTAVAPEENAKYVSALGVLNHPFSRGDVHIKSTNPEEYPVMDAHYFEDEFDMTNMISHIKMCRRIRETEPFKSMIAEEVAPGPELQTDEQLRDFVCKHMTTAWHGLGTTAMLPREHAGVVDPQLKVYGTNNLRVVDLGIIPLHLATHTHSVAYVIGEKAADIIKATW